MSSAAQHSLLDRPLMPAYLPPECVVAVLQHVPLQQRLTACALVCRAWSAAAAAATTRVELLLTAAAPAVRQERAAGFSRWLMQRPRRLQSLTVHGNFMSRPTLLLPTAMLQHLQRLDLQHCRVKFVRAAAAATGKKADRSIHAAWPAGSSDQCHDSTPQHQQQQQQQHDSHALSTTAKSADSSSSGQSQATADNLQHLILHGCALEWPAEGLQSLSSRMGAGGGAAPPLQQQALQLHNLKHLQLQLLLPGAVSTADLSALQLLVPVAFQQMTGLTSLVLQQLNSHQPALLAGLAAGLGGMQQLCELRVESLQLTDAALRQLPSSITLLELSGAKQLSLSSSCVPSLTQLSGLQQLLIEGIRGFEARLLFSMPVLKVLRLRITSSRFLPDGTTGTQDLLAALQLLREVEVLDLRNVLQHLLPDEQVQAYCGLTASSALQQLDLSACRFPPKCGQLLFAHNSRLPLLRHLVLYRGEDPPASVLQLQSLSSLACCCPALQDVAVWLQAGSSSSSNGGSSGSNSDGSSSGSSNSGGSSGASVHTAAQLQLAALQQLSGLNKLVAAGPGVTDGQVEAIAQLQKLRSLAMYRCSPLTNGSLLCLTALTQLTSLAVDAHSCVTKWPGFSQYLYLQGLNDKSVKQQQDSEQQDARVTSVCQQLQRLLLTGSLW